MAMEIFAAMAVRHLRQEVRGFKTVRTADGGGHGRQVSKDDGWEGGLFRALSGKVESGFPSESAIIKESRAFHRFCETVKCSRTVRA
jgi:nitrate reductase beta subunit